MKAVDSILMQDDRIAQASVHDYMERFAERWAPGDRRANAEFQADFLLVIQAVHRDAMKPMERALMTAFAALPPMTFAVTKDVK